MKDLVERLRGNFPKKADCVEAADEIVRLRNLLDSGGVAHKQTKKQVIGTIIEGSSYYRVLCCFYDHKDLTADEVGELTGMKEKGSKYEHRRCVSDLALSDFLFSTKKTRLSSVGHPNGVYAITEKGKRIMEELGYGK